MMEINSYYKWNVIPHLISSRKSISIAESPHLFVDNTCRNMLLSHGQIAVITPCAASIFRMIAQSELVYWSELAGRQREIPVFAGGSARLHKSGAQRAKPWSHCGAMAPRLFNIFQNSSQIVVSSCLHYPAYLTRPTNFYIFKQMMSSIKMWLQMSKSQYAQNLLI